MKQLNAKTKLSSGKSFLFRVRALTIIYVVLGVLKDVHRMLIFGTKILGIELYPQNPKPQKKGINTTVF
jgi:hypothetical protein